jgi:hypothetical protein
VPLEQIAAWFTHRREQRAQARLQIGHIDFFAAPKGSR